MKGRDSGTLLVLHASQLLTLAGSAGPRSGAAMANLGSIPDGALLAEGGRVKLVGTTADLAHLETKAADVIDASGRVVMPGFVDAHTHLVFAGSREREIAMKIQGASYQEIAQAGGGILSTVEATRRASEDQLVSQAKLRLRGLLSHGTTTAEVKSGYGLTTEDEVKLLRAVDRLNHVQPVRLVPTFLGAHALPPEFQGQRHRYVRYVVEDMLPKVGPSLARFCDVFVEEGFFTLEEGREILTEGKRFGMRPKVHADELSDGGGASLAAEVGAASADHLIYTSDEGLDSLARSGIPAVLLPGTPLTSELPFPDGRRFVSRGVPVALGTDLNPNAWMESMQLALTLACYRMHLSPSEAITAATINAACAVGMGQDVGSLEPGKLADLLVLDVERFEQIPYRFGGNVVKTVVKEGRLVDPGGKI